MLIYGKANSPEIFMLVDQLNTLYLWLPFGELFRKE
jgi:hypothetical protein